MSLAVNLQEDLIQKPLVAGLGPSPPQIIGVCLPKLERPLADGFIAYNDSALSEEFFHITKAQREAIVEPHRVANDVLGEPKTFVGRGGGSCRHAASIPHLAGALVAFRKVDNALLAGVKQRGARR